MAVKTLLIEYDDAHGDVMGGYPLRAPAVEVVRCRDCKHSEPEREDSGRDWYQGGYWCELLSDGIGWFCEPDGFCAWGERKVEGA